MPYNYVAKSFHRLSSSKVRFYLENGRFAFLSPPQLGSLGATYDVHLRLNGKRVVDFLLVLIEFFAKCYGWSVSSEYRLKIGVFVPTGSAWPKISGRRGRPHQPFLFSQNYAKWSFMWYKNVDTTFVLSQITRLTDGQTNRPTNRQTDWQTPFL